MAISHTGRSRPLRQLSCLLTEIVAFYVLTMYSSQVHTWASHEQKHHSSGQGEAIWRRNSSRIRAELRLPREGCPWSGRPNVSLRGVCASARQVDLANIAFEARVRDGKGRFSMDSLMENSWVDLSLTVLRRPWAGRLRPFNCRSHLYAFGADRCIDGRDSMRLLGWPQSMLCGADAGDLLYLAADSGSLPLASLVSMGMWCNPWGSWHE